MPGWEAVSFDAVHPEPAQGNASGFGIVLGTLRGSGPGHATRKRYGVHAGTDGLRFPILRATDKAGIGMTGEAECDFSGSPKVSAKLRGGNLALQWPGIQKLVLKGDGCRLADRFHRDLGPGDGGESGVRLFQTAHLHARLPGKPQPGILPSARREIGQGSLSGRRGRRSRRVRRGDPAAQGRRQAARLHLPPQDRFPRTAALHPHGQGGQAQEAGQAHGVAVEYRNRRVRQPRRDRHPAHGLRGRYQCHGAFIPIRS